MPAKRICHAAGLLKKLDCKKMCRESSAKGDNRNTLGTTTLWVEWFSSRPGCSFSIFHISNFLSPGMPLSTESDSNSHHLTTSTTNACYPKHDKITPCSSDRSCSCRPYLGHQIIRDFQWPHGPAMEAALLEWVNALGVPCFRDGSSDGFCVEGYGQGKEMNMYNAG